MRRLKYFFSKITPEDKAKLIGIRQAQLHQREIKSYLLHNIKKQNWYICNKISTYSNLFKFYREFWNDIIPEINAKINSTHEFSIKELYYLSSFLKKISYEPDMKQDKRFIKKLVAVLSQPKGIVLLPTLCLPKQLISNKQLHHIQNHLLSLTQNLEGQTFRKILFNGMTMQYWSSDFMQKMIESKIILPKAVERNFKGADKMLEKNQYTSSNVHRSKFEVIFEEHLKELGYIFEHNVYIGRYEVDFLINDKIIVEFNGNYHYCSNDFTRLNAKNRLKNKELQQSGYLVINVDMHSWNLIVKSNNRTSLEQKLNYVCNLIENKYIEYLQSQKQQTDRDSISLIQNT